MIRTLSYFLFGIILCHSTYASEEHILIGVRELQKKKPELHRFFEGLIRQKLHDQFDLALQRKSHSKADREKFLESSDFQSFTDRVIKAERTQKGIRNTVDYFLDESRWKNTIEQRKTENFKIRQQLLALWMQKSLRDQSLERSAQPQVRASFLERLLASLRPESTE